MSISTITELTAWANMRLVSGNCCCENILKDIMEGERMKTLVEKLTGTVPKRLGSLDGLTPAQKVIRVDWFIDALKQQNKLPQSLKISSQYFAQHSTDHIYPVLWHLISNDIALLWEIAPTFQKSLSSANTTMLTEPLKDGPQDLTNNSQYKPYYQSAESGKFSTFRSQKRAKEATLMTPEQMMMKLVNTQLKTVPEGRRLKISDFQELTDSKILCALVNSFVPGTFTSEVLLNDRWSINLALQTAAKLFKVDTKMSSGELNEGDDMGACAFLTYFFLSGYQLTQARAIVTQFEELNKRQEDLQQLLQKIESSQEQAPRSISLLQSSPPKEKQSRKEEIALQSVREELSWLSSIYNIERCQDWVRSIKQVQADVRESIAMQMSRRFDIVTVPENTRGLTINELCETYVINLSLTSGNGFYTNDNKETLWTKRKMVARDKESGEFYDDFSGADCPKGSLRGLLGLHLTDVIEVVPSSHINYELFFESSSRNKILKAGSKFLYQVFPGTPNQCQRLLRSAAKGGDLETIQKLVVFFKSDEEFVNSLDTATGNTPLHFAARNGHFESALYLLENGALVNTQNNSGCTPFFVSVEGLHKKLSQLLIEWGANIDIPNKKSKTALEIVRNSDLKKFLERVAEEHSELVKKFRQQDKTYLEEIIQGHISGEKPFASLTSRCVDGYTLLHWAVKIGSFDLTKMLLAQHIDPDVKSYNGSTALHLTRHPTIAKLLLDYGAYVNFVDKKGNTPLHCICLDMKTTAQVEELITVLLEAGVDLTVENDEGWLPIHCAALRGHIAILEILFSQYSTTNSNKSNTKSLGYIALNEGHLLCTEWLVKNGSLLEEIEATALAQTIFTNAEKKHKNPIDMFRFLLKNGLNVNTVLKDGKSLLHYAVGHIYLSDILDLLLESNVDINSIDGAQMTPLFVACQNNNFYAASKLLQHGADYRCNDAYGKTAFDYIKDHEEWIDSGYFTENIRAHLKAYSLKHARLLVKSISEKLKESTLQF